MEEKELAARCNAMTTIPRTAGIGFVGGLLVGMTATWALLQADPAPSSPASLPTPEGEQGRDSMPAPAAVDAAAVQARLDQIVQRLAAIEAALPRGSEREMRVPVAGGAAAPVAVDVASLQQALQRIEQQKLEALSDEALLRSAFPALKGDGDVDEAVRRLQLLLQRPLKPELRAEALVQLGVLQRTQGSSASLQASAETLRSVAREQGIASRFGMDATYQLIWTASKLQNHSEALGAAEAYSASPSASPFQRAQGRWAMAIVLEASGDRAAARAAYDAWLLQHGDAPENAKMAIDVRERRNKL